MISFEKITAKQFAEYAELFVNEYGEDLIENHGYEHEVAARHARTELAESFPDGTAAAGNHLVVIKRTDGGRPVTIGYLWYSLEETKKQAFICDFYIQTAERGQGYGKAAIEKLEEELSLSQIKQLGLRVAYSNDRALKLYERIGFQATGINMVKKLQ